MLVTLQGQFSNKRERTKGQKNNLDLVEYHVSQTKPNESHEQLIVLTNGHKMVSSDRTPDLRKNEKVLQNFKVFDVANIDSKRSSAVGMLASQLGNTVQTANLIDSVKLDKTNVNSPKKALYSKPASIDSNGQPQPMYHVMDQGLVSNDNQKQGDKIIVNETNLRKSNNNDKLINQSIQTNKEPINQTILVDSKFQYAQPQRMVNSSLDQPKVVTNCYYPAQKKKESRHLFKRRQKLEMTNQSTQNQNSDMFSSKSIGSLQFSKGRMGIRSIQQKRKKPIKHEFSKTGEAFYHESMQTKLDQEAQEKKVQQNLLLIDQILIKNCPDYRGINSNSSQYAQLGQFSNLKFKQVSVEPSIGTFSHENVQKQDDVIEMNRSIVQKESDIALDLSKSKIEMDSKRQTEQVNKWKTGSQIRDGNLISRSRLNQSQQSKRPVISQMENDKSMHNYYYQLREEEFTKFQKKQSQTFYGLQFLDGNQQQQNIRASFDESMNKRKYNSSQNTQYLNKQNKNGFSSNGQFFQHQAVNKAKQQLQQMELTNIQTQNQYHSGAMMNIQGTSSTTAKRFYSSTTQLPRKVKFKEPEEAANQQQRHASQMTNYVDLSNGQVIQDKVYLDKGVTFINLVQNPQQNKASQIEKQKNQVALSKQLNKQKEQSVKICEIVSENADKKQMPICRHQSMNWRPKINQQSRLWTQGNDRQSNQKVQQIYRCSTQFIDKFMVRSIKQSEFQKELDQVTKFKQGAPNQVECKDKYPNNQFNTLGNSLENQINRIKQKLTNHMQQKFNVQVMEEQIKIVPRPDKKTQKNVQDYSAAPIRPKNYVELKTLTTTQDQVTNSTQSFDKLPERYSIDHHQNVSSLKYKQSNFDNHVKSYDMERVNIPEEFKRFSNINSVNQDMINEEIQINSQINLLDSRLTDTVLNQQLDVHASTARKSDGDDVVIKIKKDKKIISSQSRQSTIMNQIQTGLKSKQTIESYQNNKPKGKQTCENSPLRENSIASKEGNKVFTNSDFKGDPQTLYSNTQDLKNFEENASLNEQLDLKVSHIQFKQESIQKSNTQNQAIQKQFNSKSSIQSYNNTHNNFTQNSSLNQFAIPRFTQTNFIKQKLVLSNQISNKGQIKFQLAGLNMRDNCNTQLGVVGQSKFLQSKNQVSKVFYSQVQSPYRSVMIPLNQSLSQIETNQEQTKQISSQIQNSQNDIITNHNVSDIQTIAQQTLTPQKQSPVEIDQKINTQLLNKDSKASERAFEESNKNIRTMKVNERNNLLQMSKHSGNVSSENDIKDMTVKPRFNLIEFKNDGQLIKNNLAIDKQQPRIREDTNENETTHQNQLSHRNMRNHSIGQMKTSQMKLLDKPLTVQDQKQVTKQKSAIKKDQPINLNLQSRPKQYINFLNQPNVMVSNSTRRIEDKSNTFYQDIQMVPDTMNSKTRTNENNSQEKEIFEAIEYQIASQRQRKLDQDESVSKDEQSPSINLNEQTRLNERWNSVNLQNTNQELLQLQLKAELKKNSMSKDIAVPQDAYMQSHSTIVQKSKQKNRESQSIGLSTDYKKILNSSSQFQGQFVQPTMISDEDVHVTQNQQKIAPWQGPVSHQKLNVTFESRNASSMHNSKYFSQNQEESLLKHSLINQNGRNGFSLIQSPDNSRHFVKNQFAIQQKKMKKIGRKNNFQVNAYANKLDAHSFNEQRQSYKLYLKEQQPKYILDRLKGQGCAFGNRIVLYVDNKRSSNKN